MGNSSSVPTCHISEHCEKEREIGCKQIRQKCWSWDSCDPAANFCSKGEWCGSKKEYSKIVGDGGATSLCTPCKYGSWQTKISKVTGCKTGIVVKTRTATDGGKGDCTEPAFISTTEQINDTSLCTPCTYGSWQDTGITQLTGCKKYKKLQRRTIKDNGKGDCGASEQWIENLNTTDYSLCPPCEYGGIDAKTLSVCPVECGGGTQTFTYSIVNYNGRPSCPVKNGSQSCNTHLCSSIINTFSPIYIEYWNVYLSNDANSASNFTHSDYNKLNSSKLSIYKINSQNAEKYRDKLVVSLFPFSIDLNGINLPYTIFYYFDNPVTSNAEILNGSGNSTLLLKNNKNDFGKVVNVININKNKAANIIYSKLYFTKDKLDTTTFYIYMILNKYPIKVFSNKLLSCTTPSASNCISNNLGNNLAVTFTININSANTTSNYQQILGITTDPGGSEKCVFGVWICPNSSNLLFKRADSEGTNGIISNCKIPIDVGLDCKYHILCNGNTESYDFYKNGILMDTFSVTSEPLYNSGQSYIFTSFNNYKSFEGTLANVVFLTSDHRSFNNSDLDNAIEYMNTNFDFSKLEKKIQEGFVGNYTAKENGSYEANDLRSMESELLTNINSFNKEYSNYKKYLYNMRHEVKGDTNKKFPTVNQSDFPNIRLGIPLNQNPIYDSLLKDLKTFNDALNVTVNVTKVKKYEKSDMKEMQKKSKEVKEMRKKLDDNLLDLTKYENGILTNNKSKINSDLYANVLWTTFATAIVYYLFIHKKHE